METAAEQVARLFPCAFAVREANGFELFGAERGQRPAAKLVSAAAGRGPILQALEELAGLAREIGAEASKLITACLLGYGGDARAHLTKMRSDRQQQRPSAGDDDAFARDREAATRECLQTACAEDAGQCPAGEGKESLARAGSEDE